MLSLESVALDPTRVRDPNAWYWKVPAVRAIREEGLRLTAPVTVIVGENGTGKSTVVEAVAAAWSSQLRSAVDFWAPEPRDEDSDLHWCLHLEGEVPRPAGGCFLRAEAMHGHFSGVDSAGTSERGFGGELNTRSHGESFLGFLESRLTERGLFILDEPESALSFTSCLRLLALIDVVVGQGSQVLLATHSPCWPQCPMPPSWSSARTASAHRSGTSSSWSNTGRRSSPGAAHTCATSSPLG